jgi:hypothetical protein
MDYKSYPSSMPYVCISTGGQTKCILPSLKQRQQRDMYDHHMNGSKKIISNIKDTK